MRNVHGPRGLTLLQLGKTAEEVFADEHTIARALQRAASNDKPRRRRLGQACDTYDSHGYPLPLRRRCLAGPHRRLRSRAPRLLARPDHHSHASRRHLPARSATGPRRLERRVSCVGRLRHEWTRQRRRSGRACHSGACARFRGARRCVAGLRRVPRLRAGHRSHPGARYRGAAASLEVPRLCALLRQRCHEPRGRHRRSRAPRTNPGRAEMAGRGRTHGAGGARLLCNRFSRRRRSPYSSLGRIQPLHLNGPDSTPRSARW